MTPEQFDLVADLIRSREPARSAARMVLVDGMEKAAAAEVIRERANAEASRKKKKQPRAFTRHSVYNTVVRFEAAHARIQAVYGTKHSRRKDSS